MVAQIELNIKGQEVERGCGVNLGGVKGEREANMLKIHCMHILKELMKMYFQKVYQGKIRRKSISFLLTAAQKCGYGARADKADK